MQVICFEQIKKVACGVITKCRLDGPQASLSLDTLYPALPGK